MAGVASRAAARQTLKELRSARRRHYLRQLDWVDALYKAYLTAIAAGAGTLLLSGALGDDRASAPGVDRLAEHGPAVLGIGVAVLLAGALRSGARGGPLALQPPDVHQILLAPIDRALALRAPALAQLRSRVFVAVVAGAVVGNLAFRRLPGHAAAWVACGMLFGFSVATLGMGVALIASGRRLRPPWAFLAGVALVAWSVADLVLGITTSPATLLGRVALGPLESAPVVVAAIGLALAVAALACGLLVVGGTSLEASLRRAGLVAQLRFAVTVQDLRTVILLRRQLAAETPRSRPWIALKRRAGGGLPATVWLRGLRSFMRWPAARVARVGVAGAVAGVALAGTWRGTTPLVIVAGLALLVAAFDAIEPLAQEIDHPTRRALLPVEAKALLRAHLLAPAAVMLMTALIGALAGFAVTGDGLELEVGLALVLPAAAGALVGAAISVITDPFQWVLIPVAQNVRAAAPFLFAIVGVLPLLGARYVHDHGGAGTPVAATIQAGVFVVALCALAGAVLTRWLAPKDAA